MTVMPGIIYGTAWKKDATETLVRTALEAGFRGIDTACQPKHYFEAGVGAGIAAALGTGLKREELYLQTKFTPIGGQDPTQVPYDARAPLPAQIKQSCEVSLGNLRTTYIDCLVLHSPLANARQTMEAWHAMESLVEAGLVHGLGISNCYRLEQFEQLHHAAKIKPSVLQNRFHAETGYDRDLRSFCKRHDIIYQSFWTLTANPHVLSHKIVQSRARQHSCSPEQIVFRYLTQCGVVPLTGTKSVEHMRADLGIFDFTLTPAEQAQVGAVFDRNS
jgi:diketogulonate reductase-like aldo/keto reductase